MTAAYWAQFPEENEFIVEFSEYNDEYIDIDRDVDEFYDNIPYCSWCRDRGCDKCV